MPNTSEQTLFIPGSAGQLEAKLAEPATPHEATTTPYVGIICHPHPLYGGDFNNKVAYTLSRTCLDAHMPALRFNFRGVGESTGQYDHGRGETADTLAAIAWVQHRYPKAKIVLAGFSFGGGVALAAALDSSACVALVTVAASLMIFDPRPAHGPNCPWLCIHSHDDDVVSYDDTTNWAQALTHPPKTVDFDTAGHFFHGQLTPLRQAIQPFLSQITHSKTD